MTTGQKTIPLQPRTWERLRAYKMGGATYDEVLNDLMDAVPLEDIAEQVVAEHRQRLGTWRGKGWRAVRAELGDE